MSKEAMDPRAVSRLVDLMEGRLAHAMPARRADLRSVKPLSAQERATESWQWFELNRPAAAAADVDQSPRARQIREINRIAMNHGWGQAVARAVDAAKAPNLNSMLDDEIESLAAHMRYLVDCAHTGCEPDYDR